MKKSLRLVHKDVNPKSAKERWTGARMTGPAGRHVLLAHYVGPEPRAQQRVEDGRA